MYGDDAKLVEVEDGTTAVSCVVTLSGLVTSPGTSCLPRARLARLKPPQLDNANTANKNLEQESGDTAPAPSTRWVLVRAVNETAKYHSAPTVLNVTWSLEHSDLP